MRENPLYIIIYWKRWKLLVFAAHTMIVLMYVNLSLVVIEGGKSKNFS